MNKKRRLLGKTAGVLAFSMILQIVSPAVIASAEDNQAYNAPQILLPETDRDFFEEVKGDIPADDNTTNNGNAQDNSSQNDVIVDEGFTYPDNSVDEGFTHPDNSWDSENSGENVTDNPQNSTGGGTSNQALQDNGVDLSEYLAFPADISGSTGGFIGIGSIKYNYSFSKNEEKIFNPVTTIDGIEYIVITNKAQLEAIGTDKPVVGGWATVIFNGKDKNNWINPTVTINQGDRVAASVEEIGNDNTPDFGKEYENGDTLTVSSGIGKTGKKYSVNENYLIVNDIDMAGTDWTPWDYAGNSIKGKVKVVDSGEIKNPVISNIKIVEDSNSEQGGIQNIRGSSKKVLAFLVPYTQKQKLLMLKKMRVMEAFSEVYLEGFWEDF